MGCGSSSAAATAVPIVPAAGVTPSAAPSSSLAVAASSPTPQGGASPKPDAVRQASSRPSTIVGAARGGELRQYDGKLCVLVSDMSGFTKQTRQHGIIHFGSKILRMRQIFHPIILRHAPLVVETEADNFLVIFDNVVDGIKCACDMMACSKAYNRRVKDKKMRIEFGGIGLDYGEVTLENPSGTMYGMAADGAFVLGEDVSDGDILCTQRVRKELKTNYKEVHETLKMERKDDKDLPFSHLEGHYFICKERPSKKPTAYSKKEEEAEKKREKERQHQIWSVFWSDWMDASFIGQNSTLLTKRHQFDLDESELQSLDDEIKAKYMGQSQVVVLMWGLKTGLVTEKYGIPHTFKLKQLILALFEPIIENHGGRAIEDFLLVFEFGYEAVACALDMAHALAEYNRASPENEQIQAKGFGIHSGPLLIVAGTNVHWGDAVSTASKLGEDLGNGRILVSDKVWTGVKEMPQFTSGGGLTVQIEKLNTSNVDFEAANLSGMYDKSHPFPIVEHHFQASFDPNATLEREALQLRAERARSIADKKEAADSVPVPIRQVSLGDGPQRTITMFDLKRNRRNSDRGSVFKLPLGAGAVEVTAGLMGDTLGRKLLTGTGLAPAQEELEPHDATTRSEHREHRERRNSKSRSKSGKHNKHETAEPVPAAVDAAAAGASPGGSNRLPPWSKDKGAPSSQMMSSPAARMGARRLSAGGPKDDSSSSPAEAKEDVNDEKKEPATEKKETEKEKKAREKKEKKEKKEKEKQEKKEKKKEKKKLKEEAAAASAAEPASPDVPSASPISSVDAAPASADLKTPEPAPESKSNDDGDEKIKEQVKAKAKEKEREEAERKAKAEEMEKKAKAAAEAEAKAEAEKKAKADEAEKEKAKAAAAAEEKEKEKEKQRKAAAAAEQDAAAAAEAEKKKQKEEAEKKKKAQEEEAAKRAKEEAVEKEKQQKAKAEAEAAAVAKQKADAEAAAKPSAAPRTVIKIPPAKAPLPPIAASSAPPAAALAPVKAAPTVRKVAVAVAKKKVESDSSSSDSSSDESDSDSGSDSSSDSSDDD